MTRIQHALAITLFAVSVAACGGGGASPTAPTTPTAPVDLKAALSSAFDALSIPSNAACSVSISQYGQVVLERGRGQIAPGREAAADSLYRIASLTKPITATAVLINELAGRLSRNDKINQFVAFPEPAPTIDELIKHVPGLPDYLATPAYQSGFASSTTVETLLSKSSFELPSPSETYSFGPSTHPSWNYAAGGVTSTVGDMNRFNQALLNNAFGFGPPESFDRSVGVTSFGMGGGTSTGELRFTHTGLVDSYGSYTVFFPADKSSVVILCNFPSAALTNFVHGPGGVRSIMLSAK